MYSTLPSFPLAILSGVVWALVAGVAYHRCTMQSRLIRYSFVGVAVAGLLWAVGYAHYLFSEPSESYAAMRWMWLGAVPYISLWVVFVIGYTGHESLLTRSTLGLVAIEPVVMLTAALTTPMHDLFITGSTVSTIDGLFAVIPALGPLFVFHQVYVFLIANVALLFLVRTLGDTDPAYHPQLVVLLIVGAVPLIGPLQQLFDLSAASIHRTPLLLGFSGLAVLLGVARYQLFDLLPTARNRVLSTMEDGVVLVDDEDRVRLVNRAARRQLSLPETVIGRDAAVVLPCGEQLIQFTEGGIQPQASGNTTDPQTDGGTTQLRPHPSGVELILGEGESETHFIVSTEPVPVETAVEGQLLVFRDVTAQREQELAFQTVIEHTTDVVLIVDSAEQISYVSPSVESELSYTQLELVGTNVCELFHPDDIEAVEAEIEAVVDTDQTIHSQYRIQTSDSSWRIVETTIQGSYSTPTTDGVIITTRDITEQYRHQQRRRVMNRVLRHDLRNDMNVVVGHAEILTETIDSERVRHAETIQQKASELVQLGEKVRKIDQRLHGQHREFKRIDLSRIVEDEVRSIHASHSDAAIRTRVEDIDIWGDMLIRTAVKNLIENAIEHNDQDTPEIDVLVTRTETNRIELRITDNGPGIPEAERRVITAGIETPLEHISGLGLWLVKWIVEGMDGELRIENTNPRGSAVTLLFPSFEAATDTTGQSTAQACADSTGSTLTDAGSDHAENPIRTTTRADE